jgi:arginine decarboxylase-like protein
MFNKDIQKSKQIEINSEGKLLLNKFEFGGGFGMSFEGECYELEVSVNFNFCQYCYELGGNMTRA